MYIYNKHINKSYLQDFCSLIRCNIYINTFPLFQVLKIPINQSFRHLYNLCLCTYVRMYVCLLCVSLCVSLSVCLYSYTGALQYIDSPCTGAFSRMIHL